MMAVLEFIECAFEKNIKIRHLIYLTGKPRIPQILCCQGFAVNQYRFIPGASDLQHPQLLQR
jgi:hypothetical protein